MDFKIIGGTGGGMERKRGVTDFYPTPRKLPRHFLTTCRSRRASSYGNPLVVRVTW